MNKMKFLKRLFFFFFVCIQFREFYADEVTKQNNVQTAKVENNRNNDLSIICSFDNLEKTEKAIREYTVCSGDTGNKIARIFYMSFSELKAINPDIQWESLKIGKKIKIRLPSMRKMFSDLSEEKLISGIEKAKKVMTKYCILGFSEYQLLEDEDACFLRCYLGGIWAYKKDEDNKNHLPTKFGPPRFTMTWYPDLPVESPAKMAEIHLKGDRGDRFEVYLMIIPNICGFYYGIPIRDESFYHINQERAKELVIFLSVLRKKQIHPLLSK